MILLSDANVLMDLGYVGGLRLLPLLGTCEVLSTVLLECDHDAQPGLIAQIAAAGIVTVDVERPLVEAAVDHSNQLLSVQDRQCLIYAAEQGRMLLSGDRHLRDAAEAGGVECHGSVWLVGQAIEQDEFTPAELCHWLDTWPLRRRRLPKEELRRLRLILGCP